MDEINLWESGLRMNKLKLVQKLSVLFGLIGSIALAWSLVGWNQIQAAGSNPLTLAIGGAFVMFFNLWIFNQASKRLKK